MNSWIKFKIELVNQWLNQFFSIVIVFIVQETQTNELCSSITH